MGNNRKSKGSKVNRLPKAERNNPTRKITIISPQQDEDQQLALAIAASLSTTEQHQQRDATPHFHMRTNQTVGSPSSLTHTVKKKIIMDDDALTKILQYAGTASTLAARDVCVQWRRVANQVLSNITRVDLSKLYKVDGHRQSSPADTQILTTLRTFTNLKALTVQSWPYQDSLPDISTIICTGLSSSTLFEVEFSGVYIQGEAIVQLLENTPSLSNLKLSSDDSINDNVLSKITSYWLSKSPPTTASQRSSQANISTTVQPRIQMLTITNTRTLTGDALSALLLVNFAKSIMVSKCHALNVTTHQAPYQSSTNMLSITNSANVRQFRLIKRDPKKDVNELNLSQCPNLRNIDIRESPELARSTVNKVLDIRKLMLSGCRNLRDIVISLADPTAAFINLEELVLFGARNLNSSVFSSIFGLSNDECTLPKLRRIELNGCSVETINLVGYQNLTSATLSGCWNLKRLKVNNCWKLERFAVSGRNIPLDTASIVIPVSCVFEGKGRTWHWQKFESHQSYIYP